MQAEHVPSARCCAHQLPVSFPSACKKLGEAVILLTGAQSEGWIGVHEGTGQRVWAAVRTLWWLMSVTVLSKALGATVLSCQLGPGWATEFVGPPQIKV